MSAAVKSGAPDGDDENQMQVDSISGPSPPIGDLEPPLNLLELLVSVDAIKDDVDLILTNDPLNSLFNFEFGQLKPLPPPPLPLPPKGPNPKPKRGRKPKAVIAAPATAAETANEVQVVLDSSPGFRAPRTRRAVAAAAAFEAEAQGSTEVADILEAGSSSAAGHAKRGHRWKRGPLLLPGQSGVPPMVDDVDNQRSFKMFDAGWILPPDQRRGGRAPVERQAVPPPRKRIRIGGFSFANNLVPLLAVHLSLSNLDRGTSHLSVFSTAASENQTLRTTPPLGKPSSSSARSTTAMQVKDGDVMDVDALEIQEMLTADETNKPMSNASDKGAIRSAQLTQRIDEISSVIMTANGTIIIEELDTPALRRAKNLRRKAERLRLAEAAAAGPSHAPAVQSTSSQLSQLPVNDGDFEMDSELSSLSDIGSDEEEAETSLPKLESPRAVAQTSPEVEPGAVILADGVMLEGGTLGMSFVQQHLTDMYAD